MKSQSQPIENVKPGISKNAFNYTSHATDAEDNELDDEHTFRPQMCKTKKKENYTLESTVNMELYSERTKRRRNY